MKTIANVKELREALGDNAVEQKIKVFSKTKREWVTAKMRTDSLSEIIEGILNCKTEAEFKTLPKLALIFEYEGTEENYKPGIIGFQDCYEDAFRKIVTNDFVLIFKREANATAKDGVISANAMKALGSLIEEEQTTSVTPTTEKTKGKNKDKEVA